MQLIMAVVGHRQPAWVDAGYQEFAKRFPPELKLTLKAVKTEPRGSKAVDQLLLAEALRLEAVLPAKARRIVLDERGTRRTSVELADRIRTWMHEGRDVAFLIGGPDGLHSSLKSTADETLRLSELTLPHAMVRLLLAETLYRSWSHLTGHPYHRE